MSSLKDILMRVVTVIVLGMFMQSTWAVEQVTYFHNDALGSPVAATNTNGDVIWTEQYQPYGKRLKRETGGSNTIWYTGKQEESFGLSYFNARWYDPDVGRFTGLDPVDFQQDNIHSFNRYAYANNNPYRYTDPTGEVPFETVVDVGFLLWDGGRTLWWGGAALFSNNPQHTENLKNASIDLGLSALGTVTPYVPAIVLRAGRHADNVADGAKNGPDITKPYKRPSGSTTKAQRESVQGKPCVKCGNTTDRQVAGHKKALVKEYYETGTIDKQRMRSPDAIQPECPTCSAREGAEMSRFSRQKKKDLGL